jgi:hypothetical protein
MQHQVERVGQGRWALENPDLSDCMRKLKALGDLPAGQ